MMATTPQHPGWIVQLAVHRAVRRDIARLSAALAEGRETSPAAIAVYWAETSVQLHHHHELEDTVVAPLMGERLGERIQSLRARNEQEHVVMAAAMDEFDSAVGATRFEISAARNALARLHGAIETHLSHEEADVLPLIPEAFSLDDVAFFTGRLPAPVREQLESSWMPRRRATVDALMSPDAESVSRHALASADRNGSAAICAASVRARYAGGETLASSTRSPRLVCHVSTCGKTDPIVA